MKITDDQGKQIKIADAPSKRTEYYLSRVGATDIEKLDFEQRKKVFLLAIKDFLDGSFSTDELSSISFKIHRLPMDMKTFEENELNDAIYAGTELTFYVRRIDSDQGGSQFDIFMFEIMQYFKKYFPF